MQPLKRRLDSILASDLVLQHALGRGIVNMRAAARWVRSTYELDESEEAILSAFRRSRTDRTPEVAALHEAREVLRESHVHLRTGMGILILRSAPRGHRWLLRLSERLAEAGASPRFEHAEDAIRVFVEGPEQAAVEQIVGSENITERHEGLSEVSIVMPAAAGATPGILSLITTALAMAGVAVIEIHGGYRSYRIFIDGRNAVGAYEALHLLTDGDDAWHI